jgi:hypothetical protein
LTVWITGARCTVPEMMHSSGRVRIKRKLITIAARCFAGYKYFRHLALITISQFSFFRLFLGFFSLALC